MSIWDVFDSVRLEVQRGLSTEAIRAALARGELRDDDLARPAGSNIPWTRIADLPGLHEAEPPEPPETSTSLPPARDQSLYDPSPTPPPDDSLPSSQQQQPEPSSGSEFEYDDPTQPTTPRSSSTPTPPKKPTPKKTPEPVTRDDLFFLDDDDEEDQARTDAETTDAANQPTIISTPPPVAPGIPPSPPAADIPYFRAGPEPTPWTQPEDLDDFTDPEDEDEAAAEFTLSRKKVETVEELDLAAMVDVAFQLVLFFLVTATTILYKTLEIPKPNPERPQAEAGADQGLDSPRTLEDLQDDYILVNIDDTGAFTVDRQPVAADFAALADRMRQARRETARTAMLLTAPAEALHRYAVLAYDAANDIGLRIAIARPTATGAIQGANLPAPVRRPAAPQPAQAPAARQPAPKPAVASPF